MAIKVNILELVESQRVADQGALSERIENTIHVWVQPPTPPKFKVNAAKMTATQLNQIRQAAEVGGQAWMELVAQLQQNAHAYYFKEGSDIEFIYTPEQEAQLRKPKPQEQPPQEQPQAKPQAEQPKAFVPPIKPESRHEQPQVNKV